METINIGTKVIYRPAWGSKPPKTAIVQKIEQCKREGDKYGKQVNHIAWCCKDYGVFDLNDGHWCYGYQIQEIVKDKYNVRLQHQTQRLSLEDGWGLVELNLILNYEEYILLKKCMNRRKNDGTMALYDFTHNPICTKHHKYMIHKTFEAWNIKIYF